MPVEATGHPYMASATEHDRQLMLGAIGVDDVDELFEQVPADHIVDAVPDLGPALSDEASLVRHLSTILSRNDSCEEMLNFLGAGTWQHHVPAICEEVWTRSEFLTSVWGTPSSDHGRNQAWFEYASQLGEIVDMEFVGLPVYSWGAALGHALRMAARLTGRSRVIVPRHLDPERMAVARTYAGMPELHGHLDIVTVGLDPATGRLDVAELESLLGEDVAAVYVENPSYLGIVEAGAARIAELARAAGAETIMGVDPISLGLLSPPGALGADIAIGTTQPLGVRMNGGGGTGGFIATRDEERYAREYPTLQVSLTDTLVPGEKGFGLTLFEQTSYGSREHGKDWTGNSVYLWAVANAVYMSAMGPRGFEDIGRTIIQRSHYAAARIAEIPGVEVRWPSGFFKEFVVDFSGTGHTVAAVHRGLRDRGIFGGKDLSGAFDEFGESALYCVTEVHTLEDIERLVEALGEEVGR